MKVAMVTPMAPESAIADVMMQAIPELSTKWDLEVWCPAEANQRPCPVPVTQFSEADADVLSTLSDFDLVLYVLGDSPWHSRILLLARRLPGLAVVHDASLTNLVRTTAIAQGELESLIRRVEEAHGSSAAEIMRTAAPPGGRDAWLRFCADVPLDDYALHGSLGAVVHSRWHARRVDGLLLGDVTVAPLPVPSSRIGFDMDESADARRLLEDLPDDAVLLVTVGMVNANRCIDLLLRAIGDDPVLAARVHLWSVGPAEEGARAHLVGIAGSLDIEDHFAVCGRVSDSFLQAILTRADIAAALRDPVLEGQSASALTQMLSGTPLLVYNHAHYAELPDAGTVKIDPGAGVHGIRAALRGLVDDPAERARRGERARDYVLTSRSGAMYANALITAGQRALAAKPAAHLSADVGARLRRLGLAEHPVVMDAVTDLAF